MKRKAISILLIITISLATFFGCGQTQAVSKTGFYFDTIITLTLYEENADALIDECFSLAEKYENLFSRTKEESEIYQINHAAGNPVTVSDETISLIQTGIAYSELSNGRFDITVGALSDVWDFSNNEGEVPSSEDISSALATVSYENIKIDGNTITLTNPDTKLDLGAIAKGYIADQMKSYLLEAGVTSGIINLGGNVLCIGTKPDESAYQIAIQKPFSEDGETIASLSVSDQSIVTSGTYQRYFEVDGVLYHHILDATTGYPCNNGLSSVTIISDDSLSGDALSTVVFLLGADDGKSYVESLDGVEAVWIFDDWTVTTTKNLGDQITITQ